MPKYPFWVWDLNTGLGVMPSLLYRLNESMADAKFPFDGFKLRVRGGNMVKTYKYF